MKRVLRAALWGALAIIVVVVAYFAQTVWFRDGWPIVHSGAGNRAISISPVSRVLISEVMSSNKTAHAGAGGLYADWVELYNSGDEPCDITGWTLTDSVKSGVAFTFPEKVLNAGESVVVYLTDVLVSEAGRPYEAPFKLSSKGDAVMLYDEGGSIMESIVIPALPTDASYARIGSTGEFIITKLYTPGRVNTNDSFRQMAYESEKSGLGLLISRIMPSNKTYSKDSNGDYSDWIEIKNVSASDVSLKGVMLSDDEFDRSKWTFPDITLKASEVYTVYCTGISGEDSAPFKLSAQGESVVLSDATGKLIDKVDYGYSQPDQIWTRQADGSLK